MVFVLVGGLGVTICFNDCCPACILQLRLCPRVSECPPRGSSSCSHSPETLEFVCVSSSFLCFNLGEGGGSGDRKAHGKGSGGATVRGSDCSQWDMWGVPTALEICSQVPMAQCMDNGGEKPSNELQVHGLIAAWSNRAAIPLLPFITSRLFIPVFAGACLKRKKKEYLLLTFPL